MIPGVTPVNQITLKGHKMRQYRQGDVLLVEIPSLPKKAKRVSGKDRIILAFGEVTGHAHQIVEKIKARLLDFKAERFLQILEKTALKHEEHSAIFLEKGNYQQAFQVEEKREEIQRVVD